MSCSIATLMFLLCLALPAFAQETSSTVEEPETSLVDEPGTSSTHEVLYPGQATPETSRHWDLELMYSEGKHSDGLKMAKARIANDPTPKRQWHTRFMFESGHRPNGHKHRQERVLCRDDANRRGRARGPSRRHPRQVRDGRCDRARRHAPRRPRLAVQCQTLGRHLAGCGRRRLPLFQHQRRRATALRRLALLGHLLPAGSGQLDREAHRRHQVQPRQVAGVPHQEQHDMHRPYRKHQSGAPHRPASARNEGRPMLAQGQQTLQRVLTLPAVTKKDQIDHRHAQA